MKLSNIPIHIFHSVDLVFFCLKIYWMFFLDEAYREKPDERGSETFVLDSYRNQSRDLSKHYDVQMTNEDDVCGQGHCLYNSRRPLSESDGRRIVILVSSSNYMVLQSFRGNAIVGSLNLEVI